jgi:pyruvate,water dikinase
MQRQPDSQPTSRERGQGGAAVQAPHSLGSRAEDPPIILGLADIDKSNLAAAGGKGASLGELAGFGIPVPPGFVLTADAYYRFLDSTNLRDQITELLGELDASSSESIATVAGRIQSAMMAAPMPQGISDALKVAYAGMGEGLVAVRSSATAEDLPEASFAGQQSTYLNIEGAGPLVHFVQECWASLFEPRAIAYRVEQGFEHMHVGIAVVVQRMVQSEASGVMFTVEPVSNDGTKIVIEAVFGLGESLVSGVVTPDLYLVDKGSLRVVEEKIARQPWKLVRNPDFRPDGNEEPNIEAPIPADQQGERKLSQDLAVALAHMGRQIEFHYGHAQDVEWAMEGGTLYVVQSRPVTTLSVAHEVLKRITATVLLTGSGASTGAAAGPVRILRDASELDRVQEGDVLVAEMTTPDFVPAMKRAAAIVTNRGGRTCHAAIVSRELGVPCVVGTGSATTALSEDAWVTVDGAQGVVYEGRLDLTQKRVKARRQTETTTLVYVNLADPELADAISQRRVDGVGLLRAEFIVAHIGEHPRHMLESGRGQEWSDRLAEGIETFAGAFAPRPVVYRTTDLKSNEYRNLIGGEAYEGEEENPMIGYRGASRYVRERDLFHLEAQAIDRVRRRYPNLVVMIPFVRTPKGMAQVKAMLAEEGLRQEDGLKLWMMVEVPSNVILLDQFLDVGIDGVSIGSNDLTQLTLGIDRDNSKLLDEFDERDPAVMWSLERVIRRCTERGVTSSICGQAPSFYPDLTRQLVEWGITSISVSPDMIDATREYIAAGEKKLATAQHRRDGA